jgi:predicted transcriptional regulator
MIPINSLNKELTLYQRGRLRDGIICDALNTYKEGQQLNRKIWSNNMNPDIKQDYKERMESLADRIEKRLDHKED